MPVRRLLDENLRNTSLWEAIRKHTSTQRPVHKCQAEAALRWLAAGFTGDYALQIAERFRPDKIILFGSFAYGTPHLDSDVDLMVVMPTASRFNQAVRIGLALPAPFPIDLLVRTPDDLHRGLEDADWFLWEVVEKGKVLYETKNGRVGTKGRIGHRGRPSACGRKATS
jgi:predicted nucleotidyltransferase